MLVNVTVAGNAAVRVSLLRRWRARAFAWKARVKGWLSRAPSGGLSQENSRRSDYLRE